MKRDPHLLRWLLLESEKHDGPFLSSELSHQSHRSLDGYVPDAPGAPVAPAQIAGHARLLSDAGFLDGADAATMGGDDFLIRRVTFSGYNFLDAVRDERTWRETCDRIKAAGGSGPSGGGFDVDLIKDVAALIVRENLGLAGDGNEG